MATRALCARLADLALLTLVPAAGGEPSPCTTSSATSCAKNLGPARLAQLHRRAAGRRGGRPARRPGRQRCSGMVTAWWELPEQARYLREHLIEHMLAAGRARPGRGDSPRTCGGPGRGCERSGPAGPYADLALIGTPRAERLRRVLGQAAHLLAPTDPPHSLIDILLQQGQPRPRLGRPGPGPRPRPPAARADQQVAAARPARPRTAPHPHRPHRAR